MNKFAERLKELRLENNLTQNQLSINTKLSQSIISAYEAGKKSPTMDVIIIFCKYFNVSSDFIIGLKDE